jgi:large subunit ribosomal protein L35
MGNKVAAGYKPCKGMLKRFKVTGTGKLKRRCGFNSHLNSVRSGNMKRRLGGSEIVHEGHAKNYRRFMGIGKLHPKKVEAERAIAANAEPAAA